MTYVIRQQIASELRLFPESEIILLGLKNAGVPKKNGNMQII